MDKKPLIIVSICAVVLLVMGSLSNVMGYQIGSSPINRTSVEGIKLINLRVRTVSATLDPHTELEITFQNTGDKIFDEVKCEGELTTIFLYHHKPYYDIGYHHHGSIKPQETMTITCFFLPYNINYYRHYYFLNVTLTAETPEYSPLRILGYYCFYDTSVSSMSSFMMLLAIILSRIP